MESFRKIIIFFLLSGGFVFAQNISTKPLSKLEKLTTIDDQPDSFKESFQNIKLSLKSIGEISQPGIRDIMAAGQLGGILHPNDSPLALLKTLKRSSKELALENVDFANAMDEWNRHNYKKSYGLMKAYLRKFPDGIWAAEAELHMGCDARFNGRYREANKRFSNIINKYQSSPFEGAQLVAEKAKSRQAVLRVMENNLDEANKLFSELKANGNDWRQRTYASSWVHRISKLKKQGIALANCGSRAFSEILKRDKKFTAAEEVRHLFPDKNNGFSIEDLKEIASGHGYYMKAMKMDVNELSLVPLPAIAHIDRSDTGGLGHYWIIEKIIGNNVTIFDEQKHRRFIQTTTEFSKEWDGRVLVFTEKAASLLASLPGIELSNQEASTTYGGCCGIQRPEADLGSSCKSGGLGCPVWSINKINLNHYVTDTPLWYNTPYGPDVKIKLSYNSQSALQQYEPVGNKWSLNYASYLVEDPGQAATVFMPDGRRAVFISDGSGGFAKSYRDDSTLIKISSTSYRLEKPNGDVLSYTIPAGTQSQQVMLTQVSDVHGYSLNFQYNSQVQLVSIQDAQQRVTMLRYNAGSRLKEVEDPFGRTAYLEYDLLGNLVKITDMGGYSSELTYDSDVYVTSITKPFEGTWFFKTELADGINNGVVSYPAPDAGMWENYRVTVTDPDNNKSEYYFDGYNNKGWYISPKNYIEYQSDAVNNSKAIKERYSFATTNDGGQGEIALIEKAYGTPYSDSKKFAHDANGRVTSYRENNDAETQKSFNSFGQLVEIRQAAGTALERVTQFEYLSPTISLPTKITFPVINDGSHLEKWVGYDSDNRAITITSKQIGAQGATLSRTTTLQYNSNSQVVQIDGPRDDVTDTTTLSYYDCQSSLSDCGQVQSLTNAMGHVTLYSDYTLDGKVGKIIEPNGLTTLITYDNLGRQSIVSQFSIDLPLQSRTVNYLYEGVNRLKKISSSDGRSLEYFYSGNGDIEQVINQKGEQVKYTNDANGNAETVDILDENNIIINQKTYRYNAVNQLVAQITSQGNTTQQSYQSGRLNKVTSPSGNFSELGYDDLQRQIRTARVDKNDTFKRETIFFSYNANDQITSTSPYDNLNTNSTVNAFNEVIKRSSPDSGITTFSYDKAGNLISQTDATNITVTYTYDALNRVISSDYSDLSEKVIYSYDDEADGNKGLGNLTSVIDPSGTSYFVYNVFNELTKESKSIDGNNFITEYLYDKNGQLTSMIYPNGQTFSYTYDPEKRIRGMSIDLQGEKTLAEQINYLPFGPLSSLTYGNNKKLTKNYDLDYRLNSKMVSGITDLAYTYDPDNNISAIINNLNNNSQIFSYEKSSRLLSAKGDYGNLDYTYNAIGSRTSQSKNGVLENYNYSVNSANSPVYYQSATTATWSTSVTGSPGQNETELYYSCPENGSYRSVWGSSFYTDDSSICTAAAQQGIITLAKGGNVKVTVKQGQSSYTGATINGVTSSSYGSWVRSFIVSAVSVDIVFKETLDWSTNGSFDRLNFGKERIIECPPYNSSSSSSIWGTNIYTSDSAICVAALHSGTIGLNGGLFKMTTVTGQPNYQGSTNNGISSSGYDGYDSSFKLSKINEEATIQHQLLSIQGSSTTNFTYDAKGNTLSKGDLNFSYNQAGRLKGASKLGMNVSYIYNYKGERVSKLVDGVQIYFIYNQQGQLIAEGDLNGSIQKTYVYLNGQIFAQVVGNKVYYYHNSHLGAPETMTDADQSIVWQANYTPFGKATVSINTIENNIRFPGQYFDSETNLHYNYFRDYDPEIGRYIQSDPIGLAGGIDTYGYVRGNPVTRVDPLGLFSPLAHDALIRNTFRNSNCVSAVDYVWMQVGSRMFDINTQAPDLNAYHNLLRPGQSVEEMFSDRSVFINQISNAITLGIPDREPGGIGRQSAMVIFGSLAHPIMDQYSPSHNLADGSPASWDPYNWRSFFSTISHSPNEWIGEETVDDITQAAYDNVRRDLRSLYGNLFSDNCGCGE